ncbi:MAG: LOG family protein [Chloroflexota bacterium]|jgi:uncharacterized protein (TIGR00730 family)
MNKLFRNYRITVFGGSQPKPNEAAYLEALLLGKLLGELGFSVLTGGYIGTMEAVSRGAAEAGAHVIGITCEQIEAWRQVGKNPWVIEENRYPTLRERLFALIDGCDAVVGLPGGVGTLAEIMLTWNELIIQAIPSKPLIVVGTGWQSVFNVFNQELGQYTPVPGRNLLTCVPDIESAVQLLQNYFTKDKKS